MHRQSLAYAPYASSRPSTLRGRESLYPVPPSDFLNSLEDCVAATEGCAEKVSSTVTALEPGISDLPRFSKVMRNVHYYLVLPAPKVQHHKSTYAASLAPQIDDLITRASQLVEREQMQVQRLEERLRMLQETRLDLGPAPSHLRDLGLGLGEGKEAVDDTKCMLDSIDTSAKDLSIAQRRKIGLLRNKRDKLEKEKARLAAQ